MEIDLEIFLYKFDLIMMNSAKLTTPFPTEHLQWLLLFEYSSYITHPYGSIMAVHKQ